VNLVGINTPQSVIGIMVVIGSFSLMALYVYRNEVPADYVIAIVASALSGVLGFFFGHSNGTTSALATAATALANRTNPGDVVSRATPDANIPS